MSDAAGDDALAAAPAEEPAPSQPPPQPTHDEAAAGAPAASHAHREVTLADVGELSTLYAAAFDDNPAYSSIFQLRASDPAAHAAALKWMFERRVALLHGAGGPFLVATDGGDGRVLAAAGIVKHSRKAGLAEMLQAGLLEWPFRWGLPSLLRALTLDNGILEGADGGGHDGADVKGDTEGELSMVAVAPGAQGRGVGSALMKELLARWDAQRGGALTLGTQRRVNVTFYERLGFVVTHAREATSTQFGHWQMRRERTTPQLAGAVGA